MCINSIDSYVTTSLLINCLLIVEYAERKIRTHKYWLSCSIERLTDVAWSKTKNTRIKNNIHSSVQVRINLCKLLIKWY